MSGERAKDFLKIMRAEGRAKTQESRPAGESEPAQEDADRGMIMSNILTGVGVSEVCSPARVCAAAKALGMKAGWSLDLTTKD